MVNVYKRESDGKKIVYWFWERVSLDNLTEVVNREFPEFVPRRLSQLELISSNGALMVAEKGAFVSPGELYRIVHDADDLSF